MKDIGLISWAVQEWIAENAKNFLAAEAQLSRIGEVKVISGKDAMCKILDSNDEILIGPFKKAGDVGPSTWIACKPDPVKLLGWALMVGNKEVLHCFTHKEVQKMFTEVRK